MEEKTLYTIYYENPKSKERKSIVTNLQEEEAENFCKTLESKPFAQALYTNYEENGDVNFFKREKSLEDELLDDGKQMIIREYLISLSECSSHEEEAELVWYIFEEIEGLEDEQNEWE